MPPLTPIPWMDPNQMGAQAFQGSEEAGAPPGAGGQEVGPNMQALLAELQQPLPAPVKIHPGRIVAAALGDALMARARVLAGGLPGPPEASATLLQEQAAGDEARAHVAEQNRALRVMGAKEAISGIKEKQKQEAKLGEIGLRQQLILDRQQAMEEFKSKVDAKDDALRIYSDLIQQPNFKAPPKLDLTTLTKEQALRMKADYFSSVTGDEHAGRILTVMDEVTKQRPGEDVSATVPVTGGGTVSVKPKEPPKPEIRALTPSEIISFAKGGMVIPYNDNGTIKNPITLARELKA